MCVKLFIAMLVLPSCIALAGCGSKAEVVPLTLQAPEPSARVTSEALSVPPCHVYDHNSPTTPVVFEGEVLERLPSDGFWCGFLASFQGIRYQTKDPNVRDTKGEVVVYHFLVGPPLCEADEPVLSKRIFAVGNRLRIKAERDSHGTYHCSEQAENAQIIP